MNFRRMTALAVLFFLTFFPPPGAATAAPDAVGCAAALELPGLIDELAALSIEIELLHSDAKPASLLQTLDKVYRARRQMALSLVQPAEEQTADDALDGLLTAQVETLRTNPAAYQRARVLAGQLGGSALLVEEFELARTAIQFGVTNELRCGPAAFRAAAEGNVGIVMGFVAIYKKGKLISQYLNQPEKYCLSFDLHGVNAAGQNLLSVAHANGHNDVAMYLINEGLTISTREALRSDTSVIATTLRARGQAPDLGEVLESAHEDLAVTMIDEGAPFGIDDLFLAYRTGKIAAAEAMLKRDPAQLGIENAGGRRLLHEAIRGNQINFVALYGKYGVDVNSLETYSSSSPLLVAIYYSAPAMDWLLSNRADLTFANPEGTALEVCIRARYPVGVKKLILALPNLEGRTTTGQTYLAYARDVAAGSDAAGKPAADQVVAVLQQNWAN